MFKTFLRLFRERARTRLSAPRPWSAILAILIAALLASKCGSAPVVGDWTTNGVFVPSGTGVLLDARPIPDGFGGVFIVAQRRVTGLPYEEVRIQHVLPSGLRDPLWPLAGVLAGGTYLTMGAKSDRAGGIVVVTRDSLGLYRLTRFLGDGTRAPGWPAGGILSWSGPEGWDVEFTGGIWSFGGAPVLMAIRRNPDGTDVPGWEPPGRPLYTLNGYTGGETTARAFAGGVTALLEWRQANNSPDYLFSFFVHAYDDGTASLAAVDNGAQFPSTYFDVEGGGSAVVTYGAFVTSSLQRFNPLAVWQWPGWRYPAADNAAFVKAVARDGASGGFLWSGVQSGPGQTPQGRLNHVLADATSDPTWPATGVVLPVPDGSPSQMVADLHGGCFLVWQEARVGPDADVYALDIGRDSSIQPGWDPLGSPVALVPGSDQKQPLVVVDAHAEFFVSWLDARSGTTEVYAQRFGGGVPVPVQVSSTSARERDGVVELSWRLHGVTGPGLQVERTVDGHSWSALGALEPGTAGDLWVYDDRAPLAGVLNRYHLRDRASGWTGGEVDVDVQVPGILTRLGVAPNPLALGSRIALSTTSSDPIDLLVNDLAGREVARRRLVGSTEGQSVPWAELYRLPPGLYWLRARQAGAERRTRFVVAR